MRVGRTLYHGDRLWNDLLCHDLLWDDCFLSILPRVRRVRLFHTTSFLVVHGELSLLPTKSKKRMIFSFYRHKKNRKVLIFSFIRTFEKSEPFHLEYSSTIYLSRKRFGFIIIVWQPKTSDCRYCFSIWRLLWSHFRLLMSPLLLSDHPC